MHDPNDPKAQTPPPRPTLWSELAGLDSRALRFYRARRHPDGRRALIAERHPEVPGSRARLMVIGKKAETIAKAVNEGRMGKVRASRLVRPLHFAISSIVAREAQLERTAARRPVPNAKPLPPQKAEG